MKLRSFARQNTHASLKSTNTREDERKELYMKIMKIILQGYNLVHKFIPLSQVMKIPDAKAAADKESEKLEKIPAWQLTKVRNKKKR